jgi:hypothetical protein
VRPHVGQAPWDSILAEGERRGCALHADGVWPRCCLVSTPGCACLRPCLTGPPVAPPVKPLIQGVSFAPPAEAASAIIRGGALRQREVFYPFHQVWLPTALRPFIPEQLDAVIRATMVMKE